MMERARPNPFGLLARLEQESRRVAPGLPQQAEAPGRWTGLGFRIGDTRLATPLDHVSEVVPCAGVTPIPGAKLWLKGIANVRGSLLTVADLAGFLARDTATMDEQARFLVLNIEGASAALIVSEVLGLRHFDEETERQAPEALDDALQPYLRGAFVQDGVAWGVFDMHALWQSAAFRNVAA